MKIERIEDRCSKGWIIKEGGISEEKYFFIFEDKEIDPDSSF